MPWVIICWGPSRSLPTARPKALPNASWHCRWIAIWLLLTGIYRARQVFTGHSEQTEAYIRNALRLSPRDTNVYLWTFFAGLAKFALGSDEEAVARFSETIGINRNYPLAHFHLAATLALLGRPGEAQAAARAGLALDPTFTIRRYRAGVSSDNPTYLALRERVYDGMRRAGLPEG